MNGPNPVSARLLSRLFRVAVLAGVESAVRIHIDRGDDLNARDSSGMTPLMLSASRNRPAICKLLLSAGADARLLAPCGKTAYEIAVAASAHEAAEILSTAHKSPPTPGGSFTAFANEPGGTADAETSPARAQTERIEPGPLPAVEAPLDQSPISNAATDVAVDLDDAVEFDLSGWEAEEESSPPDTDLSVVREASAIQIEISTHETVDSSTEWGDIDAYLPGHAAPLVRADDAEARARLRLLLLHAIREGSVPNRALEELSISDDDQSFNLEAVALLRRVINDLGAEVDERLEYIAATDSIEFILKSEEAPDEEDAVDEALAAIDSAASSRNEPLRIYLRECQRLRLISAQDEIALSQSMEMALEAAIDALAAWPNGVARTLAAGSEVMAGLRPLAWMSLGGAEAEPEPAISGDPEAEAPTAEEEAPDGEEEEGLLGGEWELQSDTPTHSIHTGFTEVLRQLGALPVDFEQHTPAWRAVRNALAALRLNRRFMLELSDIESPDVSSACARYVQAMVSYRQVRDRMAAANLKLVFHLAKKYLYSGEPLDDLTQAGNIGLLKAVERYDWRRGYRFTTYATWWIRQQIGRHVADNGRTIRIPVHVYEKYQRFHRETQAFELETGRTPSLTEIAVRMNMPADRLAALEFLTHEPLPIHELPVDELVAVEARDRFIPPDPEDIVSMAELPLVVDSLLACLTPREQEIVRLRYGIGIQDSLTLEEIGQRYGLTRERIRQIEAKAHLKLKRRGARDAFVRSCGGIRTRAEGGDVGGEEEGGAVDEDGVEQSVEPKRRRRRPAPPSARECNRRSEAAHSSSLDQLLTHAAEMGVSVVDERDGKSGRVWVYLLATPEYRHRRLARKLIDLGFEFWSGKGYWR